MKKMMRAVAATFLIIFAGGVGCESTRAPASPTLAMAPPTEMTAREHPAATASASPELASEPAGSAAATAPDQGPNIRNGDGAPESELEADRSSAAAAPLPRPELPADLPAGAAGELVRYGRQVVEQTPAVLQEAAQSVGDEYTGNLLACTSCHRQAGTAEGALSWFGAAADYPRYQPRAGRAIGLEEQVNDCLERNLNAAPLSEESREIAAVLAWLEFLGQYPAMEAAYLSLPNRRADMVAGEAVYRRTCQRCHGADGGLSEASASEGVPPLWGPQSYTTGSGLHRVLTAAAFLREQMPPGATPQEPELGEEEAFDLAAYLNSFARPEPQGLERDYPALSEKPADCAYPPYADRFPADQHKYGPFLPILLEAETARAGDWRRFRNAIVKFYLSDPTTAETGK